MIKYDADFYELSKHVMTIGLDEEERVCRFVRGSLSPSDHMC